jgi:large conductance mechanosensitive channel
MSILKEFRDFVARGNVVDLAVGVVIGAAFGKIVSSLVGDIIMPPLGMVLGGIDFSHLRIPLRAAVEGKPETAVAINYGIFVKNIVDFLLVSFAIFGVVKLNNRLKKPPAAPPVAREVELLTEIRDALVKKP